MALSLKMVLSALVLLVAGHQAYMPDPVSIDKLERARYNFFHATIEQPNCGWRYGSEGSDHAVFFPIGRADRLYFIDYQMAYDRHPDALQLTCWTANQGKYSKVWQMNLKHERQGTTRKGTLFVITDGWSSSKFRFDETNTQWRKSKSEILREQDLAEYAYGEHGDVGLQAYAFIAHADGTKSDRTELEHYGRMLVTPAEVRLMKSGEPKPTPPVSLLSCPILLLRASTNG